MRQASVAKSEVVALLAQTLGEEKARETVDGALGRLQLAHDPLEAHDAMRVLEHIAEEPGLVGITARFAVGRVIFKWGTNPRSA